jgi:GH25 family lysozyme M1 (1,4-beta-N-acetylmuramidase)
VGRTGQWITAVVVAVLLPATTASAAPAGYSVTGIDVSAYQQSVNWTPVVQAGTKFAYVKATEGMSYVDAYFTGNYTGAKRAGLYAGAYHYALPDRGTGTAQADFFMDHSRWMADGYTLPPVLDIEWPWRGSGSPSPCYGLSPAQLVAWLHDFVNEVQRRTGRPAMIYTNTNWWNPCTGGNAGFTGNPLFISGYTASPPPLPAGWSRFTMWQYADSGPLPGDQDVFNGDLTALAQLAV